MLTLQYASRSILLLILAVTFVFASVELITGVRAVSAPSRSSLTRNLRSVEKRIRDTQARLRQRKREKKSLMGSLIGTQRRLESAQDKVTSNKLALLDAQAELKKITERLERTQRQFDRRADLLSGRMVDLYEGADISYLEVLLGSRDMQTFLTRAFYIRQIVSSDVELIEQIKKDKEKIDRDRKRQAVEVQRISSIQIELVQERDRVASLADDKQTELQAVENDLVLYEQMYAELIAESRSIESELQRFQSTKRSKGQYSPTFSGNLMMPVSGRITSPFGYRIHPITGAHSLHTGVDIACPTGSSIKAAADGEVVMAGWRGAYGNTVVVDHGGGVSTLYGHNSKLLVKVGDKVKQGQTIAKSGSTGWSTGPHCHFEKRVNGKPVNPL